MSVPLERVDVEERTSDRAEELAQKQFGFSFVDLDNHQQMHIWMLAEQQVQEELNEAAERSWDERHERWAELELMRRLGK